MPRTADLIRRIRLVQHKRPAAGEAQQTLVLLPWLNLNDRVAVGPMLLDRLSRVVPEMPPDAAPTAEAIAKSFRDIRGRPVDVSMCWFADRGPTTEIAESEVDTVRDYILAAMLSAISENWYLSYRDQVHASHFHRVFQNFLAGTETVAGTSAMRRLSRQSTARGLRTEERRRRAAVRAAAASDLRQLRNNVVHGRARTSPRADEIDQAISIVARFSSSPSIVRRRSTTEEGLPETCW